MKANPDLRNRGAQNSILLLRNSTDTMPIGPATNRVFAMTSDKAQRPKFIEFIEFMEFIETGDT